MPTSKRKTVTPEQVLRLFLSGRNTVDIAAKLGVRESDAYKLLRVAREAQRIFNDPNRSTTPTISEPSVEDHKDGWDVSLSEIRNVEESGDMGHHFAGEESND
jgi:hypothetical protein